ncbi:hypothetical protein [Lentzea sp.]|uniref:hypothetical protein n=1 Tax=Lentzea sp. TaxID=56099 RepID=UPI002C12FC08|nr:hypothetical protein [Lentzea sp.]HUQ60038.1 hypothetical protein [Lentzea sp.]
MPTIYRASGDAPVPPVTELSLGRARLVVDEIVLERRHHADHTPLTAIDHLEVSGRSVRVVLISGATTVLPAPNPAAAHAFAAAVAAALAPVEDREPVSEAGSTERRPKARARWNRTLVITVSLVVYLVFAGAVLVLAGSVSPDGVGPLALSLVVWPIFTPVAVVLWLRHWKPLLARRRRGITVIGERTGGHFRDNMTIDSYSFTTADGQSHTGSEPGVKSRDGKVEIVYDPENPEKHQVELTAWGTAIPYVASIGFGLGALTLPAALIYVFGR